jgi:nitrogen fixation/metabolism regulation signal transduction histidine kinase
MEMKRGLCWLVVGLFLLLTSCATKTKIEYRDRDVNHYITKVEKDTVTQHAHDSIYFEVIQKGDTVYKTKYKEKYIYLDKIQIRTDTCWRDSVVTEYKETTKEVTKIPKIFKISLIFSILCCIFALIKLIGWMQKH